MRGMSKRTLELLRVAYEVLKELKPITLRQLHYAIFSLALAALAYANTQSDYRRLSRITTASRRRHRDAELRGLELPGEIPHEWIVDELRNGEMVSVWDDVDDYLESVQGSYRRDAWHSQPHHVEIWAEKNVALLATLRPVTRKLGIMLRPCRGFGSGGMEGAIGRLFEGVAKPIKVFYIGDHDPSGIDIERDIHRRVELASGKKFSIMRLAILGEDIARFNLPPQIIKRDESGKTTDSRAPKFISRYGTQTVEADALPPDELRRRVKEAVESLIDWETWDRERSTEAVEFDSIRQVVETVKNLLQAEMEEFKDYNG